MERIIRSNAFTISSQLENSGTNFHDLHPDYELAPEMALIQGGSVASSGATLPELLTNTHAPRVTTPQSTISNTGNNWSTSLQALLNQQPSDLPYLILLSSVAFVIAVLVWTWTGKTEKVSHVRGRFLALGELYKLQPQDLDEVAYIAGKVGQEMKAGQVVVELDRELKALEVEVQQQQLAADQMRFNQIKALMDRGRMLTQSAVTAGKAEIAPGASQSAITVEARLETEAKIARPRSQSALQTQQTITEISGLQTELARRPDKLLAEELTQLQTKIAETKTLLNTAKAKLKKRFLHPPVDEDASSLNIRRTLHFVQARQSIAEIAPEDVPLILVATLPHQEADFVKKGDSVQITLDAHSDQDESTISGRVLSISTDVKPDEDKGQVYQVEVALNSTYFTDKNQTKKIKAGQTATAKIIHHRRIADMFLKPIKHLQKGESNL